MIRKFGIGPGINSSAKSSYGGITAGTIPVIISAIISNTVRNKVVLTCNTNLNASSVPAVTDFSITGKTISEIVILGTTITITVTVAFVYGDVVTISYTEPAVNPVKSSSGGKLASFVNTAITNNITSYPLEILDGKTIGLYDSMDVSTFTKDGSELISTWADKLGSGRNLTAAGSLRPIYSATDGVLFTGGGKRLVITTNINNPQFIYLVLKRKSDLTGLQTYIDGQNTGIMRIDATSDTQLRVYTLNGNYDYPTMFTKGLLYVVRLSFKGNTSFVKTGEVLTNCTNQAVVNLTGFMLGGDSTWLRYADIEVKECIIRSGTESAQDEATIYNYLHSKYILGQSVPSNTMLGLWNLNGDLLDSSGNNRTLTNSASPATLTTDRYGFANKAYDFSGSSQYLSRATIAVGANFAFTLWFKADAYGNHQVLFGDTLDASMDRGYALSTYTGVLRWWVKTWDGSIGGAKVDIAMTDTANWHFAYCEYGNGALKFSIDNGTVGTATGTMAVNGNPMLIGKGSIAGCFNGKIDGIRFYNRVLTPTEVTQIYRYYI